MCCLQFGDRFVLDLPYPFPGQAEFFTDIFKAHRMIDSYTEEITDHFFLAFGKVFQDFVQFPFLMILYDQVSASVLSAFGFSITSISVLSSPSEIGVSILTCRDEIPSVADTSSVSISMHSASSSAEGSLSNSCSSC